MRENRLPPTPRRLRRVRAVSILTGVSIRTLHYYDEIGLLNPQERSRAGYRLYSEEDIFKLQQILIQRELGFPLEDIRRSFETPGYDRRAALHKLREELTRRTAQSEAMLAAVDRALSILGEPDTAPISNATLQTLFRGFDPARFASEAEKRWGATDVWRISLDRTRCYTLSEWQAIKSEQDAIFSELSQALQASQHSDSQPVLDLAERHRLFIDRWFYPCSPKQHLALTALYESDPRFRKTIDRYGPGLTSCLVEAIRIQAARQEP